MLEIYCFGCAIKGVSGECSCVYFCTRMANKMAQKNKNIFTHKKPLFFLQQ